MLKRGNLRRLFDYPTARDVFPDVEIKGGVRYFLIDTNYHGACEMHLIENGTEVVTNRDLSDHSVLIRYPMAASIVDKVSIEPLRVESLVSADTPFGIPTNPKTSKKTPFDVFDQETSEHNVTLYYNAKQTRLTGYVRRKDIKKNAQDIDRPKAIFPKTGWSGNDPNVLGKPELSRGNSVCSQTYLCAAFDSYEEVENFIKYYKSRFFRFLVSVLKITQDAMKRVYHYVPMQDFTDDSDIDWSLSLDDLDGALFDKYGFTSDEREFVLTRIDPMV